MSNLLVNARDQVFLLFEQLGIEKLFQTEIFKDFSKDDALMMMTEAEKMALNVILPTYTAGDKEGCTFKDGKVTVPKCYHEAFKKYVEGGWLSPVQPIEVGGQGDAGHHGHGQPGTLLCRQFRLPGVSGSDPRCGRSDPAFRDGRAEEQIYVQDVRRSVDGDDVSDRARRGN